MDSETKKTLTLILSGKNALSKKYAGKHVLVVMDKVFIMKEGEDAVNDFNRLKKEYGESPVITFVPRQDISYIFIHA